MNCKIYANFAKTQDNQNDLEKEVESKKTYSS